MLDDPAELAALQRLALMFVPEAERAHFWLAVCDGLDMTPPSIGRAIQFSLVTTDKS